VEVVAKLGGGVLVLLSCTCELSCVCVSVTYF
jgi:hypothetical protein